MPRLRQSHGMPELFRLAGRAPFSEPACCAIIAGMKRKNPKPVPPAPSKTIWWRWAPALNGWPKKPPPHFPELPRRYCPVITVSIRRARHLACLHAGETHLLIGTQIIAKGHHFPDLTLVGVIDADLGLAGGDLRAAERTFQMLHQVSGRAGRAQHPGHAVLQTYMPEHPVMRALVSGDQEKFLAAEAEARRARNLPPFGRLVSLIIVWPRSAEVRDFAALLARHAPHGKDLHVLGPAPAPLALLRGRHRTRLLLMATRQHNVQALLRHWLAQVKVPPKIRLNVDVDPYSFL